GHKAFFQNEAHARQDLPYSDETHPLNGRESRHTKFAAGYKLPYSKIQHLPCFPVSFASPLATKNLRPTAAETLPHLQTHPLFHQNASHISQQPFLTSPASPHFLRPGQPPFLVMPQSHAAPDPQSLPVA